MSRNPRFSPIFQILIDNPEHALSALRANPEQFADKFLDNANADLKANAAIPAAAALSVLLFDERGCRIDVPGAALMPEIADASAVQSYGSGARLVALSLPNGSVCHALWADAAETENWNLPAAIRDALAAHPNGRLLLVAGGAAPTSPLDWASEAFGLTDLERRVATAVVRTGSGRAAATATGLAYSTVRPALTKAARKFGVPNLPALVRALVAASFGVLPGEGEPSQILADMLPLTERQVHVATLVAEGLSREAIADVIRVSPAVVKKELEQIFAALGIGSSAELARLVTEVQALRLFARSTDGAPGFFDPAIEPTRFTLRPGSSAPIAWSDYGPRSGRPILLVHSNWQCRAAPRPLVRELQRAGYRPIAIDRPGFGSTPLGRSSRKDPFGQAIDDALVIFDLLGVGAMPIIARCGAQFVLSLAQAAPERVGQVMLVSPSPSTREDGLRQGIVGVVKEAMYRNPRFIEFFFKIISAQLTLHRTETLTRAIVKGSPSDEALLSDPQFIRDRFYAIRPFTAGKMAGAIIEEHTISLSDWSFEPLAAPWTVLQGDSDPHNDFAEVYRYWSSLLPNAHFEKVEGGGRFMTSSHAQLIVDRFVLDAASLPDPSAAL